MSYALPRQNPLRTSAWIGTAVLLHLLLGYALVTGLARKFVEVIKKPLEVAIIEEIEPPPPPPPSKVVVQPKVAAPPPPFVPPPEVAVQAPPPPVIAVTTPTPPPAPPPVLAAAQPAPPPAVSVSVACSNHAEVLRRLAYPPQAQRMGLSGDVLVEFVLSPAGTIANVHVLKSSHPAFNAAATEAVSQLRCAGQGRDVRVRVPFSFRLDN